MLPVVIFSYNRIEEFEKVLTACRGLPVIVYLDGPRTTEDEVVQKNIVDLARSANHVINVHHSNLNLGCKRNVMNGVVETLQKYPAAIFLEDDCVPVNGFYEYTLEALEKFYANRKIGLISLSNLIDSGASKRTRASIFINCWGWATWSNRIYETTDIYSSSNELASLKRSHNFSVLPWTQRLYWRNIFIFAMNQASIWDFYIQFRFFVNDLYSIVPPYNLINNIGFTEKATHTKFSGTPAYLKKNFASNLSVELIKEIDFSAEIDYRRDLKISKEIYQFSISRLLRLILGNGFRLMRRIFI